jgi:hypothetical protein
MVCIGSIAQLEQEQGVRATDLHRESIDDLETPSKQTAGTILRRVHEVFDCWFESWSMPYAQSHYPFEKNKDDWEKGFPADFIAEGLDQPSGWFYTLVMVLSSALFDKPAWVGDVNGVAVFRFFAQIVPKDPCLDSGKCVWLACVLRITTRMENDAGDDSEGCSCKQPEKLLLHNQKLLKKEQLPTLKITEKSEHEEQVRTVRYNHVVKWFLLALVSICTPSSTLPMILLL